MCIIIDTNTLALVFDKTTTGHDEFKPVFDWIFNDKGKVVYGGTKYKYELKKYLSFFNELRRANKAVYIDDEKVDGAELTASKMIEDKDFDDQHIVGLLIVSKCKLICSHDKRAYPFFKHDLFFTPANKKPKIYSGKRNHDLLADRNIAEICQPCLLPNTSQKKILSKFN
ncbi:hypothetical protein [Flavobacterium lindanitolerans]|uniref:hypothetical protein n=1 Tax=Flavobacterium lindanitolerans TaxID=428988 RepID=UPI0028081423|nr:hypothetical protein [Flavobacterium lindanitolerans]MDQ7959563.1 hypothetical protein [Flavobacterium lindanitolerans]